MGLPMERSDQMGRGGAPLGRLWTWKTWAVLAVLASSHGACCFTIQVWSGGVGARRFGASSHLLHSLRRSLGSREGSKAATGSSSGMVGCDSSTFSAMALEAMRPVMRPQDAAAQRGRQAGGVMRGSNSMEQGDEGALERSTPRGGGPTRETQIETYCPDPLHPRGDALYPIPDFTLPPLIHHIKCGEDAPSLLSLVHGITDLPRHYIEELLAFGAIYLAVPHPKWHPTISKVEGMGKAVRVIKDCEVPREGYVRVHVNPRRHAGAVQHEWSKHIIDKSADYIVVDKPAGVPTVPTVDNLVECALHKVSVAANNGKRLYVTSRLDACTSGLVVFGRSPAAAGAINKVIREQKQTKVYRLLCQGMVSKGILRNKFKKMRGNQTGFKPTLLRAYKEDSTEPAHSPWQLAELEVLSCKPLFEAEGCSPLFECEVRLVTGRTHQIRLQFAALGFPLVGDSRYQPVAGLLDEGPNTPWKDGAELFGREPEKICLQSSMAGFSLDDGKQLEFKAGKPWWHDIDQLKAMLNGPDWQTV